MEGEHGDAETLAGEIKDAAKELEDILAGDDATTRWV